MFLTGTDEHGQKVQMAAEKAWNISKILLIKSPKISILAKKWIRMIVLLNNRSQAL